MMFHLQFSIPEHFSTIYQPKSTLQAQCLRILQTELMTEFNPISMLGGSPCHNSITRLQVVDGRDSLQNWRLAANILNKQPRTNDKGWSSRLGIGRGANNPSL
jgi:hypothetical protein